MIKLLATSEFNDDVSGNKTNFGSLLKQKINFINSKEVSLTKTQCFGKIQNYVNDFLKYKISLLFHRYILLGADLHGDPRVTSYSEITAI